MPICVDTKKFLMSCRKKKVERAQLLLCTTDMPVKEVAYLSCFRSQ